MFLLDNTESSPSWSKTYKWYYTTGLYSDFKIALSGNGKYIASIQDSSLILLDNIAETKEWAYSNSPHNIEHVDIGYNPIKGRYYIVIGDDGGNITLFDDTSNLPLWSYNTTNSITSMKISNDGSHVITKVDDDKIYFFNNSVETSKSPLWTCLALDADHVNIDISSDGESIIIVEEQKIRYLNNTLTDPKQQEWEVQEATNGILKEGFISGDGTYVLVGGDAVTPDPFPFGVAKLYNRTITLPKIEDWNISKGIYIPDVAINKFGNYFALLEETTILHFYHHNVPVPQTVITLVGDDDDDDKDENELESVIFLGSLILIFSSAAIISSIVIVKRKTKTISE
ncbi:MAG: hypothetical protein GF383_08935 [Candidatus Lokiarchaeota archaeon]|nr:hypothetical protein [Candidatus Lokiarchaeota archaeon]MBD3340552.1 hypothetical protein [Candidatus Lokiarchaeota archaeon]